MMKIRRPPNPRFSLMRFDFKLGKVVIEEPRRPLIAAWEGSVFERYVAAINALALKDHQIEAGESYCDAESWRDAFDDGLTPSEAWAEEVQVMMEVA